MFPIARMFSSEEVEALVCTAAELWAATSDPHDILSAYQKDLVTRAHELLTDDAPDDTAERGAPETAIVIAHHDPAPFAVDEPAFARWLAADHDRVEGLLPGRHDRMSASDLVVFFDAAREADAFTADPRLDLLLDPNDPPGLPGFTLMLRNHRGSHSELGVTTGFTELLFPDTEVSTGTGARFHLEHIIGVANSVLCLVTGRP
ncbi:hypothetical protein [Nocardia noduli]|uniref:hypothetical protein n=1 Tax=Nocardia noduli TaxID=2815722 RepID=UPI001C21D905|nr:hypothetical protein [Nocardia noduli]